MAFGISCYYHFININYSWYFYFITIWSKKLLINGQMKFDTYLNKCKLMTFSCFFFSFDYFLCEARVFCILYLFLNKLLSALHWCQNIYADVQSVSHYIYFSVVSLFIIIIEFFFLTKLQWFTHTECLKQIAMYVGYCVRKNILQTAKLFIKFLVSHYILIKKTAPMTIIHWGPWGWKR